MTLSRNTHRVLQTLVPAILISLAAVGTLVLASCNTVEGAGKDIEKAGEGIQDAAK